MKRNLLLFIFILPAWICSADNYYCKTIGLENGLTQSSVTDVAYDGSGSLWIGTRFGLNEFRNGKLKTYYDDGSGKITGNYINLLFCDSHKTLWVSTDMGLFHYDLSSDSFLMSDEHPVFCASENEDLIFFGGHNGIAVYDYGKGLLTPGNAEKYTDYVMLDRYDGALLSVDRKDGVKLEYKDSTVILDIPGLAGNLIMNGERSGDILYLSVINTGLVEYDLRNRVTNRILNSGRNGMPSELILSLLVDRNHLWMGFDGAGLRIMERDSGKVLTLDQINQSTSGGIIPNSITKLFKDPFGNIWAGSVRSGLVGLKLSPIKLLSAKGKGSGTVEDNIIISICKSDDGSIYVGTDGAGVKKYTEDSSGMESYPGHNGLKVTSITDFDRQRLIVSIYNSGFFLMDRKNGGLTPFTLIDEKTNEAECLHSNAPKIYKLDDSKLLLLAVNTYLYNKDSGTFLPFDDESGEDAKELVVIGSPVKGFLYAFSAVGLFRIGLNGHSIKQLYKPGKETGRVRSAVYHNGVINFGTDYGLFEYDIASEQVSEIESELFTRVSQLQYGTGGNLWVAADNTLFLYRNGVFEVVGENKGVPANEFLTSMTLENGNIFFGGTSGLIEIGKNYEYNVTEDKKIVLHGVNVTGKRTGITSGSLTLKHNYSSLMLSVNLSGADPFEKVLYRYKVEGKNGYTPTTLDDNLEIPELKQGNYKVMASYMMPNGRWSTPECVLGMRVSPPWYKSLPMIILYILSVLSLIAIAIDKLSRKRLAKIEAELKAKDLIFTNALQNCIKENMGNPDLNVADIARNMAMSRAALYYKVNSSFGKGVAELIEEQRMSAAEDMLKNTSMSVLDISEKVGYSTSRYFSTRFKHLHKGITPLKYRQNHRD